MPDRSAEFSLARPEADLCSAVASLRHDRRAGLVLAAEQHAFQPGVARRESLADVVLVVAAVARPVVVPEGVVAVACAAAALDAVDFFGLMQAREVRRRPSTTRPDRIPLCASPGSSSF